MGNIPNNNNSLDVLNITNQDLPKILNIVVQHEKKCDYYNDSLLFSIHLQIIEGVLSVQIESIGNRKIQIGNEKGCLEHQGHLFFISGKHLDSTLFSISGENKSITYYEPKDQIDSETGEPILDIIEDDSYSTWIYRYANKRFVLTNHHTFCE